MTEVTPSLENSRRKRCNACDDVEMVKQYRCTQLKGFVKNQTGAQRKRVRFGEEERRNE